MSQASPAGSPRRKALAGLRLYGHDWPTRLRLLSGLTMLTFVTTHLTFHAMGLVSLGVMERGLNVFLGFWTSGTGEAVLGTALGVHLTLVLTRVVQRTTLRLPAVEWLRLVLGLLTLFLLTVHVASNYLLYEVLELSHGYAEYLLNVWPWAWPLQFLLLVSAWTHGCIGVHMWLRVRAGYRRVQWLALGIAVLLPAAALAGLLAGAEVSRVRALDPAWVKDMTEEFAGVPDLAERLARLDLSLVLALASLVTAVFTLRALRVWRTSRHGVRLVYPGREVVVPRGTTVLEASRMHGIPHASVCGGRGRCSTCRVRVVSGYESLPPTSEDETKVLRRINAPANVRLACQVRCESELEVFPLVPPTAGPDAARPQGRFVFGTERDIAILFSDIRGFTRMTEQSLAYDTVHILNQYFEAMSQAVQLHHGYVDKFIGDGMMALFGLNEGAPAACRHAMGAAREMAERLEALNGRMSHTLFEPLRIGIGIHTGPAIVGEMGNKTATSLTALGDSVNTASRVEGLTKRLGIQLVITPRVAELAGVDLGGFKRFSAAVRGKAEPLTVIAVPSALDLPAWVGQPQGGARGEAPSSGAQVAQ
ncbi:MAG: adenylate/guanylate cyclase domain-containing protein [SAR324 cluster bacterium]